MTLKTSQIAEAIPSSWRYSQFQSDQTKGVIFSDTKVTNPHISKILRDPKSSVLAADNSRKTYLLCHETRNISAVLEDRNEKLFGTTVTLVRDDKIVFQKWVEPAPLFGKVFDNGSVLFGHPRRLQSSLVTYISAEDAVWSVDAPAQSQFMAVETPISVISWFSSLDSNLPISSSPLIYPLNFDANLQAQVQLELGFRAENSVMMTRLSPIILFDTRSTEMPIMSHQSFSLLGVYADHEKLLTKPKASFYQDLARFLRFTISLEKSQEVVESKRCADLYRNPVIRQEFAENGLTPGITALLSQKTRITTPVRKV